MKKVGILTINNFNNYGNRLQNYALQEILKRENYEVETIKQLYGRYTKSKEKKLRKNAKRIFRFKLINKRFNNFMNFEKNMKYSEIIVNKDYIPEGLNELYDYFVIGSDQVWNYTFSSFSEINFALYAPKEKVISYAASFGLSSIEEDKKEIFVKGLNNINNISVREEQGSEIVKELIGRDVPVLLDPTLLLDKEEWSKVSVKPKNITNKKYILTYFLGNISKEREEKLKKIANENDFEIINLAKTQYSKYYIAGPSEFLWYIQNAEIVFTDSFHACVFSIIFDKAFYILEREQKIVNMNSRIETLLSKFKLPERKLENWDEVNLAHNYSHVEAILKEEKEKSLKFLRESLKK